MGVRAIGKGVVGTVELWRSDRPGNWKSKWMTGKHSLVIFSFQMVWKRACVYVQTW